MSAQPRQPLAVPLGGGYCRSWWWSPGSRNKKKAKRRSARRERTAGRREIERGKLTSDETLALLDRMEQIARQDADREDEECYWDGWADALATLRQHILTGVKVTCFPVGSCPCHPFKVQGRF